MTFFSFFFSAVDFLADLYIHGKSTYIIEDENKLKTVSVNRTQYHLSQDALMEFEQIHDHWELHICQKNPHDALIGGNTPWLLVTGLLQYHFLTLTPLYNIFISLGLDTTDNTAIN